MKSNVRIIDKQGGSIMVSEKKKAANAKWDKANSKVIGFKCMFKGDKDILDWLDQLPQNTKATEIKKAIRLYMEAQKKDL